MIAWARQQFAVVQQEQQKRAGVVGGHVSVFGFAWVAHGNLDVGVLCTMFVKRCRYLCLVRGDSGATLPCARECGVLHMP